MFDISTAQLVGSLWSYLVMAKPTRSDEEPIGSIHMCSIGSRSLAAYASSVSFGHPEHCFLTVWTPKNLCQNLLMMTFLRR